MIRFELTNLKVQADRKRYLITLINININVILINSKYYYVI